MQYPELRRQCAALVHQLDRDIGGIPRPFDLNVLLDRFEAHRGRLVDLHATTVNQHDPCGLWVQHAERDVIVYAENTSTVHQTHIVLHEIGHMLCGHRGECDLALGSLAELAAPQRPGLAAHLLARTTYGSPVEQEAEMVGTLIRLAAATPQGRLVDDDRLPAAESTFYERVNDLFG